MSRQTFFTVIIPTHNGRPSITEAVASVLAQSHTRFELVVVCDGDGSRTRAMLADVLDPRLRIVEQPRSGVSRARNRGVSSARYDWITFLDDDDTARANWLETWSTHIEEDTVALTARLAFWEGDHLGEERDCRLSPGDPTMDASSILPGGFALRRDLFASVGGFDEALTAHPNRGCRSWGLKPPDSRRHLAM